MRQKLSLLTKTMLLLGALMAGGGSAWATDDTAGFSLASSTNTPLSAGSTLTTTITGTASEEWNVEITGQWTSSSMQGSNGSKYWQMGKSGAPITSATFSTTGITGTISKVVVNCASYSGYAKINCTVGGNTFGTQNQATPSWANNVGGDVTFSGSASAGLNSVSASGISSSDASSAGILSIRP